MIAVPIGAVTFRVAVAALRVEEKLTVKGLRCSVSPLGWTLADKVTLPEELPVSLTVTANAFEDPHLTPKDVGFE